MVRWLVVDTSGTVWCCVITFSVDISCVRLTEKKPHFVLVLVPNPKLHIEKRVRGKGSEYQTLPAHFKDYTHTHQSVITPQHVAHRLYLDRHNSLRQKRFQFFSRQRAARGVEAAGTGERVNVRAHEAGDGTVCKVQDADGRTAVTQRHHAAPLPAPRIFGCTQRNEMRETQRHNAVRQNTTTAYQAVARQKSDF